MILERQQGRDPDGGEAHQRTKGRRGDRLQIVRQQIGGYGQHAAAGSGDDDVVTPVRPRRKQDRNDVENRDRALERRQHIHQENRDGEDGRPEPQPGAAHG
ncbi:hypothetical protein [Bradyrhizobium sp. CCGB20]|uniref:hypothetical protein n=1 Tax=Bradyrhizobium sp. CCGB20 TaxID=2949633 RepID=UPI0020B2962B|nr:hypothetical protein [Bradyrhizobium sp. CCGB20]MCP3398700.1 hypothetical protein [Bradyrhizobium sp. CCGB20]